MQAAAAFNYLMNTSKPVADWAPEDAPTPHEKSKAPLDDLPVQGKIIIESSSSVLKTKLKLAISSVTEFGINQSDDI
jgi:hypothetical protein